MLSNGERRYLKTKMNFQEIKEYITANDWIKLYHSGVIHINNGMRFTPKEVDIQTCSIVGIVEEEDWYEQNQQRKLDEQRRLKIIKEIEDYKLNKLDQFRLNWKLHSYPEDDDIHKWINFTDEYLNKMLEWVKKRGKKY